MRWSDNGMLVQGKGGGMSVRDPSGWLDAYWMGRYFGMILPPKEPTDPDTVEVLAPEKPVIQYDGPPMPDVLGVE